MAVGRRSSALRRAGVATWSSPLARAGPRWRSCCTRPTGRGRAAARPDRRANRGVPGARAGEGLPPSGSRRRHVGHRGGQPPPGGARGCSCGRVPMLVLSADRPAALRGPARTRRPTRRDSSAPAVALQSTCRRGRRRCGGGGGRGRGTSDAGRSQLNLQFDDPLLPDGAEPVDRPDGPSAVENPPRLVCQARTWPPDGSVRLGAGPRTVVVAGDDAGPPRACSRRTRNWPLLAEPTSGARTGAHAIRTYRLLLGGELGDSRSSASW